MRSIKPLIPYRRGLSRELNQRELDMVWDMALIHTRDLEIAHALDFSLKDWIVYKTKHPEVQQMIDRAMAEGAVNLRRAQFKSALEGNVNMQIWLGRAILSQNKEIPYAETGHPIQLADISPESRQHLLELREAIYKSEPVDLTDVKVEVSSPAPVGERDEQATD